jgi:ribosomal protein L7/L12
MTRLIIITLTLGLLTACKGEGQAKDTSAINKEPLQMTDAATAVDSPIPALISEAEPKPVPKPAPVAEVRAVKSDTEPQDTLRPKSIRLKRAKDYLRMHIEDESTAKEIQVYLEQDEKVSAVRKVSEVTSLDLPEAKAFVDSLDVLMGTNKIKISPRSRIQRKKKTTY